MKIFLAGASGVIGRNLIPRLVSGGHEVVGMTGDAAKSGLVRSLGARPVIVQRLRPRRPAGRCRAGIAGRSDRPADQPSRRDHAATNRVRTEGTRNLIDAAELAGTPAMVAQSYCIYAPGPGLADESDPLDVNSPVFGATAAALMALEGAGSRRTH